MTTRIHPLICVHDVEASSQWYQRLLGCQSGHGGPQYERLVLDGTLILQLHNWHVEHQHGPLGDPALKPYGNGVLLWFELEDFEAAVSRAEEMKAEVIKPRHRSENAHYECWLRDLEGYTVVLASPLGSAEPR
ncbi:MAG: VOC family protein [Verrucomicrobiota bacterium]